MFELTKNNTGGTSIGKGIIRDVGDIGEKCNAVCYDKDPKQNFLVSFVFAKLEGNDIAKNKQTIDIQDGCCVKF